MGRDQYGYITRAFLGSPRWGEINLVRSGCGANEQKACEKGWKWVKLGENPKMQHPQRGRSIKTCCQTTMMPKVSSNMGPSTARRPSSRTARARRLSHPPPPFGCTLPWRRAGTPPPWHPPPNPPEDFDELLLDRQSAPQPAKFTKIVPYPAARTSTHWSYYLPSARGHPQPALSKPVAKAPRCEETSPRNLPPVVDRQYLATILEWGPEPPTAWSPKLISSPPAMSPP